MFEKEGRVARNEWVARATTQHMSLPARLEERGSLPDRTRAGGEGIIGKAGKGNKAFCGLVIFHRQDSSFLVRIEHVSPVR